MRLLGKVNETLSFEEWRRRNADKYRNYPTLSNEDRDKVSAYVLSWKVLSGCKKSS